MRVVNVALPIVITATFFGFGSAALAGGSSAPLDPYSYIQAPTKEEREAMIAKKNKKKKSEDTASASGGVLHRSVQNQQDGVAGPFDVVLDGVKQSTAGLGKGAKAAGGKIASGTAGMFRTTASLPSKLLGGGKKNASSTDKVASTPAPATSSAGSAGAAKVAEAPKKSEKKGSAMGGIGEKISGMNKAVAGGFMSAGGAVKSGTVSVAKGFKTAGGKLVDGTQAAGAKVASLPKAIGIGGKSPKPKSTAVASTNGAGTVADGSNSAGASEGLRPAVPMNSAAALPKTESGPVAGITGAAKKLAGVPKSGFTAIGHGFGKLNPFNKDKQGAPDKTSTAAKEAPKSL